MESKIFNGINGRMVYDKRTICEVIKQAYDLTYLALAKKEPALMDEITKLLEEAYLAGIKMTKKLVENKVEMPDWDKVLNESEVSRIRKLRVYLDKELNRCGKMTLAVVCDLKDYKMSPQSYSKTYYDMVNAVFERFGRVRFIRESCNADEIEADVILFYDVHSTHEIEIEGIEKHPAVKYEYFNDLHQGESRGTYPNGQKFHKLGPKQRTERAMSRGVQYLISPSVWGYDKYIKPYNGQMEMLWFPPVPKQPKLICPPLKDRRFFVGLQGHLWKGVDGFRPYEFRRWVANQKSVVTIPHAAMCPNMPIREAFLTMLTKFKGCVAACEYYPVAKYFEIPLAGCVMFAQKCEDFDRLNLKDGVHCIVVDKNNFDDVISDFLAHSEDYQGIATAGHDFVSENWTAQKFADFLYEHAEAHR